MQQQLIRKINQDESVSVQHDCWWWFAAAAVWQSCEQVHSREKNESLNVKSGSSVEIDREGESESESEEGKTTPELRNVQTELLLEITRTGLDTQIGHRDHREKMAGRERGDRGDGKSAASSSNSHWQEENQLALFVQQQQQFSLCAK